MEPVIKFVGQFMNDPDWRKRYSALAVLGAITKGPEKTAFMQVIVPGLPNLLALFND